MSEGRTIVTGKRRSRNSRISRVFAGDLVARIFPIGIFERRFFGDEVMGGRLLVGAGGADENELARPVAKEVDVALDVRRKICDPIHDHVERAAAEQGSHCLRIAVDIAGMEFRSCGDGILFPRAAVKKSQVPPDARSPAPRRPS